MANISTYLANALLGHAFDYASYTMPAPYLGLFTTTPTMPAGTGGVEVTGGSYARQSLTAGFAAPSAGSITNVSTVTFPTPTASWGSVTGVGLFDASTSGNLLWAAPLAGGSVAVGSGVVVTVNGSALTATLG